MKEFRQLRKVVSAGESYSLLRVIWTFVTLQTVYMHNTIYTKGKGKTGKAQQDLFK